MIFSGRHPTRPIMQMLELRQDGVDCAVPTGAHAAERVREAAGATITPTSVIGGPVTTHPYFVGAQFHPELTGRPLRPQPMFMGLIAAAIRRKYAASHPDLLRRDPELARWVRGAIQTIGV
jgi:hypothetical protein